MENKQELQMSPIGINLPENYDAKKLLQALKKNYERCEKRVVNNHDYKILFEYLDLFLDDSIKVVNAANGGRSSRSFINEGRLYDIDDSAYSYSFSQNEGKSIESCIKEGDFLFIQFGHNDDNTKIASSYTTIFDRMVPLGEPDGNGIYPVTAGVKTTTSVLPSEYVEYASDSEETKALAEIAKYGSTYYAYGSGTYKWYLKQYIDFARSKGAIPVLVTPVAELSLAMV